MLTLTHSYAPDGILLEVPYTMHYWTAATDGCVVGILIGLRKRVAATTRADGDNAQFYVPDCMLPLKK